MREVHSVCAKFTLISFLSGNSIVVRLANQQWFNHLTE